MSSWASYESKLRSFALDETVAVTTPELTDFEDTLVLAHLPMPPTLDLETAELAEAQWTHRTSLLQQIKPDKFSGNLFDITLTTLPDPIEGLLASGRYASPKVKAQSLAGRVLGVAIRANLSSSRSGLTGYVDRHVWYVRSVPGKTLLQQHSILWQRVIGADEGNNNVQEAIRKSRRIAQGTNFHGGGAVSNGRSETGHIAVNRKTGYRR